MQTTTPTTTAETTSAAPAPGTTVVLDPGQVEYLASVAQADTLAIIGSIFIGFFFLVGPLVFNSLKGK